MATVEESDSHDLPSSTSNHTLRANTPFITTELIHKAGQSMNLAPLIGQKAPSVEESPSETSTSTKSSYRFFRSKSMRSESSSGKQSSRRNTGIVIGDFTRIYPDELTLTLGERIEIISKHVDVSRNIGWWTARNSKGETGLVPVSCVKVVTSSVSGDEDILVDGRFPIEIPPEEVELMDVIGIGGFGKVHRALYKGQEVAVKVARQTNFDTVKVITEVLAEAEKFARLAHENVCALVGVSLVKDVYLVIEYAKGGALSRVIHDRGLVVPVDVSLDWALQIANGMCYLHHEVHPCMIHRDLKSSNILLQNVVDEKNFHNNIIKITDFGLAREIEHTTRMSTAGTYPWMAPEVIKSSEFSPKSDVWSFGVILWELLTGEKPYTGLNMYLIAYGVGSGSLKLPIHEKCPRPLAILLHECWQRAYMDRPSFKTIVSTLTHLSCNPDITEMDYELFKSLQLSWKFEIQRCFQEHKKNESGFEDKQKDLLSKMKKQNQKVEQLEKEKQELVGMIEKYHSELQKMTENEQRPPRLKPFSIRKMIEKMMIVKDKRSSRAESLAKEIERKMKDIDATEDLIAKRSQLVQAQKRPSYPLSGLGHQRQSSDSLLGPTDDPHSIKLGESPPLSAMQKRTRSFTDQRRREELTASGGSSDFPIHSRSSLTSSRSPKQSHTEPFSLPSKRHNSVDNINTSSLFDSGKDSLMSFSSLSNEVQNLIDFEHSAQPPNIFEDLDPLKARPTLFSISGGNTMGYIIPTSQDSLLSDTVSPSSTGKVRGFSPPLHSTNTIQSHTSPRQSLVADISSISRPRPRPNSSHDSTSAPTSRPGTPKLHSQSSSISPSGSVQSLPPYPTSSNEVSYFASDSSTSLDIDETLFDPEKFTFPTQFNYH